MMILMPKCVSFGGGVMEMGRVEEGAVDDC